MARLIKALTLSPWISAWALICALFPFGTVTLIRMEFTAFLETLAKLVEATAKDPQDAARIIREAIPK